MFPYIMEYYYGIKCMCERIKTLEQCCKDVKTEISNIQNQINDLGEQINSQQTEINNLGEQINNLQTQINNLGEQINEIKTEIINLGEQINNMQTQINNLGSEINNIKIDIQNIQNEIDTLNNEIDTINNEIDNINGDITNINNQITHLQAQINNIYNYVESANIAFIGTIFSPLAGEGHTFKNGDTIPLTSKLEQNGLTFNNATNVYTFPRAGTYLVSIVWNIEPVSFAYLPRLKFINGAGIDIYEAFVPSQTSRSNLMMTFGLGIQAANTQMPITIVLQNNTDSFSTIPAAYLNQFYITIRYFPGSIMPV